MRRVRLKLPASIWPALVIILMLAAVPGCRNPFSPIDDLDKIPESVLVNGTRITMKVLLYLDLMPGVYPEGSPLFAVIELTAEGSARFPDNVAADRLWVTNRTETWETRFSDEQRPKSPAEPNKIVVSASGGPKWEKGTMADVVVRLKVDGKISLFIKSLNNEVGAVW